MLNWQNKISHKIISLVLTQVFLLTGIIYPESNTNKNIFGLYISDLLAETAGKLNQELRVPMGSSTKNMLEALSILTSQRESTDKAVFTNMEHGVDEGIDNYVNIKGPSFKPDVFQFTMRFIESNIAQFVNEHSISKFDIERLGSFLRELWHNSQVRGIGNFSYETYLYKPRDSDEGAYLHISILQDGIKSSEDDIRERDNWANIKTLERGFKDKGTDYLKDTAYNSQREREKTFYAFGNGFFSIGYLMDYTDVYIEYKRLANKGLHIEAWVKLDPFIDKDGSKQAYYSLGDFMHRWSYDTLLDIKVEPQGIEFLHDLKQQEGFRNITLSSTDSYQKLPGSGNKYDVITIKGRDFIKVDIEDFFNTMKKLLNNNGVIIIRTDVFLQSTTRQDLIRSFLKTRTDFEMAEDIKIDMDEFLTLNPFVIRKKEIKNDKPKFSSAESTLLSEKAQNLFTGELRGQIIILKGYEYSFKRVVKLSSLGEEEKQKFFKALFAQRIPDKMRLRLMNYAEGLKVIDIYAAVEDTDDGWGILALQMLDVSHQNPALSSWIRSDKEIPNQLGVLAFTINDLLNRGIETVDSFGLSNTLRIGGALPPGINNVLQMRSFLEEYTRSINATLESASNSNASAASVLQKLELAHNAQYIDLDKKDRGALAEGVSEEEKELEYYLISNKLRPGSKIMEIDIYSQKKFWGTEIRGNELIKLNLNNIPFEVREEKLKDYRHIGVLYIFSEFSTALAGKLEDEFNVPKEYLKMAIRDLLQNALLHGNKLDFDLPIFIYLDSNSKVIEIYDCAKKVDRDTYDKERGRLTALGGSGVGTGIISENWDYTIEEGFSDSYGNKIGTKVSIKYISASGQSTGNLHASWANVKELYERKFYENENETDIYISDTQKVDESFIKLIRQSEEASEAKKGETITIQGYNFYVYITDKEQKVLISTDLAESMSDGEELTILSRALLLTGFKKTKDGLPLIVTSISKSPRLFEDCRQNGFIGINQAFLRLYAESKDNPAHRKYLNILLQVGLEHELIHEKEEKDEEFIVSIDIRKIETLCNKYGIKVNDLIEFLSQKEIIDKGFVNRFYSITGPDIEPASGNYASREDSNDFIGIVQGEYGFTSADSKSPWIKTCWASEYIILVLYDKVKKIGMVAHFDINTDLKTSIRKIVSVFKSLGADIEDISGTIIGKSASSSLGETVSSAVKTELLHIKENYYGVEDVAVMLDTRTGLICNLTGVIQEGEYFEDMMSRLQVTRGTESPRILRWYSDDRSLVTELSRKLDPLLTYLEHVENAFPDDKDKLDILIGLFTQLEYALASGKILDLDSVAARFNNLTSEEKTRIAYNIHWLTKEQGVILPALAKVFPMPEFYDNETLSRLSKVSYLASYGLSIDEIAMANFEGFKLTKGPFKEKGADIFIFKERADEYIVRLKNFNLELEVIDEAFGYTLIHEFSGYLDNILALYRTLRKPKSNEDIKKAKGLLAEDFNMVREFVSKLENENVFLELKEVPSGHNRYILNDSNSTSTDKELLKNRKKYAKSWAKDKGKNILDNLKIVEDNLNLLENAKPGSDDYRKSLAKVGFYLNETLREIDLETKSELFKGLKVEDVGYKEEKIDILAAEPVDPEILDKADYRKALKEKGWNGRIILVSDAENLYIDFSMAYMCLVEKEGFKLFLQKSGTLLVVEQSITKGMVPAKAILSSI